LAHERGNPSGINGPLSVLLLIRSLEMGGAERQLVELARGMQRRGHRVTVAAFYKRGPLLAELETAGIPVTDLAKRGRWDVAGFLLRARKAVAQTRPDVVYSFLGGANLVATAATASMRSTRLVWSIRASRVDLSKYDWLHKASYRIERLLSNAPDLIIANSAAGRDFAARQGFPPSKIQVIHNGIDVERFRPDPRLRQSQRRSWELAATQIAVGVLGRLDPMKDQANFLRAAAVALQEAPSLHFLCIGDGPDRDTLEALAASLGIARQATFTGIADSVAALNALDIACSSSSTEGFPNAVAEAMACGLPCIVTDVGDSAVIVGDFGVVVPPRDPAALGAAIVACASELHAHSVAEPRRRILDNFGLDSMVDRTIALLKSLRSSAAHQNG
jgi:glycosyltransferase involved in cell wall biosynthesis